MSHVRVFSPGENREQVDLMKEYAEAGVTWWLENFYLEQK